VLGTAAPVAFVTTTDPERARAFYADVLGLRFVAAEEFALVFDLQGAMLRIPWVDRLDPQPFTVLGWRVEDVAGVVRELTLRGVHFARYPELRQDALGIWSAPSGARVAWFPDPDGNVLSVSEYPAEGPAQAPATDAG
jgi:catechol 2,3-dioxygenase-like lactoylglutathione lyase family enzyme